MGSLTASALGERRSARRCQTWVQVLRTNSQTFSQHARLAHAFYGPRTIYNVLQQWRFDSGRRVRWRIVELAGRLTVNDQPGLLKEAVATPSTDGARHVLLDLSGVHYIDSTRLGELIAAHVTVSRKGGRLRWSRTPNRIIELLRSPASKASSSASRPPKKRVELS